MNTETTIAQEINGAIYHSRAGQYLAYVVRDNEVTHYSRFYDTSAEAKHDLESWAAQNTSIYGGPLNVIWWSFDDDWLIEKCLVENGEIRPEQARSYRKKDLARGQASQRGVFNSELERGYIMQKIALQRLHIAWVKAMTTCCDVERLQVVKPDDAALKAEAIADLKQAQACISSAKGKLLFISGEACADLINPLGSYQTMAEAVEDFRGAGREKSVRAGK